MLVKIWFAGGRLLGQWIAVVGGTAFQDIGDIDILPLKFHRRQNLIEKLAGPADKGYSLTVFLGAGSLADEHDIRVRIACAENELGSGSPESAALAFMNSLVELLKTFRLLEILD